MNRYKVIKNKYGWLGFFQTSLNFKNIFILHWDFIYSSLHPSTRFGFTFLGFVIPKIKRHRSLLAINFFTWDGKPAGYLSIMFLYMPSIDLRIGNCKTWFWIRSENWYAYKCDKENRRKLYGNDMPF